MVIRHLPRKLSMFHNVLSKDISSIFGRFVTTHFDRLLGVRDYTIWSQQRRSSSERLHCQHHLEPVGQCCSEAAIHPDSGEYYEQKV